MTAWTWANDVMPVIESWIVSSPKSSKSATVSTPPLPAKTKTSLAAPPSR
ncbi:MAG: hypothetical protein ACKVRO_19640 [Micropepsaceae bacterium]